MFKHRFRGADTAMHVDQSIATINVRGVITDAVSIQVLSTCHADLARTGAAAMVARYDAARVQVNARTLLRAAGMALQSGDALRIPTALVVHRDDMEMWRSYCYLQGMRGVLRAPFTDPHEAAVWASRMAAMWAAPDPVRG